MKRLNTDPKFHSYSWPVCFGQDQIDQQNEMQPGETIPPRLRQVSLVLLSLSRSQQFNANGLRLFFIESEPVRGIDWDSIPKAEDIK